MSGSKNNSIKTLSFDTVKNEIDGTKFYKELLEDVKYFDTLLKKFDDEEAKQTQYGKDENKNWESNLNESNQNQLVIQDNRNSKSRESNPNEGNQSQYVNDDIESSKIGESPNESNSSQISKKKYSTNKSSKSCSNKSKQKNRPSKSVQIVPKEELKKIKKLKDKCPKEKNVW